MTEPTTETYTVSTYLGDGLYATFNGFGVWLRAPRREGEHVVFLEPVVWRSLLTWLKTVHPDIGKHMGGQWP